MECLVYQRCQYLDSRSHKNEAAWINKLRRNLNRSMNCEGRWTLVICMMMDNCFSAKQSCTHTVREMSFITRFLLRTDSWYSEVKKEEKCPPKLSAIRVCSTSELCNYVVSKIKAQLSPKQCKLINFMKLIRNSQGHKSIFNRWVFWHKFFDRLLCAIMGLCIEGLITTQRYSGKPMSKYPFREKLERVYLANFCWDLIRFCFWI